MTQKRSKLQAYHFVTFSKYSLETLMLNLVSLPCSSPRILNKTQTGVLSITGFNVMTPEPLLILTLKLNHYLNLIREI